MNGPSSAVEPVLSSLGSSDGIKSEAIYLGGEGDLVGDGRVGVAGPGPDTLDMHREEEEQKPIITVM